ncbi:MAG: hypothetical protein HKN91_08685 [Acidimicrobiia bacterium]|nr:hypothetical protein [Acidimicrobiia bacterium]
MNNAMRADVERWFIRRGVPHFISGYSATDDVLTRALPVLVFAFLLSAVASIDLDWPWWGITLAIIGGLGVLLAAWAGLNTVRGRPRWALPDSVGGVEIGVFLLVPVFLPLIFGGDLSGAGLTFITQLVVLGLVYAATSYGVAAIGRWAFVQLWESIGQTFRLFTRALPLLLLGFMFLFINAEAWQSAGRIDTSFLVAVVVLFAVLGIIFLLTQISREIPPLTKFDSWDEITTAAKNRGSMATPDDDPPPTFRLTRREWGNLGLVLLIVQSLRILIVSSLVGLFFVALGLLIISPDTIELWTTAAPNPMWRSVRLFGSEVQLSRELLQVALFLGGFAGVYFAVYTTSDATLRAEFFEDTADEVREALAVRTLYRVDLGVGSEDGV